MMNALDWNLLLLRDNPFSISPPEEPEEVVWAGLPELKNQIEQELLEARSSATAQVILNRGPLGGGKTHALRFYSLLDNWPPVDPGQGVRDIVVIPVLTPKETGKADKDFYIDVLERLGMVRIRHAVISALREVGPQAGLVALQRITGSESLGRAIQMLGVDDSPAQGNFLKTGSRAERDLLLDAYFLDGCTKAELRKLGLARNIDKAQDRFRVLAGLLHCFIGLTPDRQVTTHSRVCLWLDELEDLVYFTAAQYRPFSEGLYDLIDRLPNFFTLLLNFDQSTPELLDEIEIILGRELVDRITDQIIFQEMAPDQALQYVQELLAHWRTISPEELGLSPLYPFEDDALRYLITSLRYRTPRLVNKRCRDAAMTALRQQTADTPGQIRVDLDLVTSIVHSELDQEMEFR